VENVLSVEILGLNRYQLARDLILFYLLIIWFIFNISWELSLLHHLGNTGTTVFMNLTSSRWIWPILGLSTMNLLEE